MSSQQSSASHKSREEILNVISYDILINCTLNHGELCTDPFDCKICGFYKPVMDERKKKIEAKFGYTKGD